MINPFYGSAEFEVGEFRNRRVLDEIEMLLTAFDCVVPDDGGVYCSSDVTTGRRLYFGIYPSHGVRSDEELKDKLGAKEYRRVKDDLIAWNIARGVEFTEGLRRRGITNLVNPGPLMAREFTQQHYHYLWECVILKKIGQSYFNEGWEYSNGCTLEYAISHRKGIPALDQHGRVLNLDDAKALVQSAVSDLKSRGIACQMLERNLALIEQLH
ncbi:MAG TPA: hypothetical protein VK422_03085 [Pyrinomonadaceae bacterium]|nr:hypothetical protein [Pyrinomonadaceae bacterium]